MTRTLLVALALLGALASPASAVAPPGLRWMITHANDRIAAIPVNGDAATADRVQGKVLAVDPQHVRFLLGTALWLTPQISLNCRSARSSKSKWLTTNRLTTR
jgi:hypothetical protein